MLRWCAAHPLPTLLWALTAASFVVGLSLNGSPMGPAAITIGLSLWAMLATTAARRADAGMSPLKGLSSSTDEQPSDEEDDPELDDHDIDWDGLSARFSSESVARLRRLVRAAQPFEGQFEDCDAPCDLLWALEQASSTDEPRTAWQNEDEMVCVAISAHTNWAAIEALARPLLTDPATAPLTRALLEALVVDEAIAQEVGVDLVGVLTRLTGWAQARAGAAPVVARAVAANAQRLLTDSAALPVAGLPSGGCNQSDSSDPIRIGGRVIGGAAR